MTVAELIAKLQAMPQDLQVTAFEGEWNRCFPMPEPVVRTLSRLDTSDVPFAFDEELEWREGAVVIGERFDAVVLGYTE